MITSKKFIERGAAFEVERPKIIRFRDLAVGQTFDFLDDARPIMNSFYARCTKTGPRKYTYYSVNEDETITLKVGSINVQVFHVIDATTGEMSK